MYFFKKLSYIVLFSICFNLLTLSTFAQEKKSNTGEVNTIENKEINNADETDPIKLENEANMRNSLTGDVYAEGANGGAFSIYLTSPSGETLNTKTTSFINGRASYIFTELQEGDYILYTNESISLDGGDYAGLQKPISITVSGEATKDIRLSREQSGTRFEVNIIGSAGDKLNVFSGNNQDFNSTNLNLNSAGLGKVIFYLTDGSWFVGIGPYKNSSGSLENSPYLFPSNKDVYIRGENCKVERKETCSIRYELQTPASRLKGKVVDNAGNPIANAHVYAQDALAEKDNFTTSDRSGNFEIGLDDGVFTLGANVNGMGDSEDLVLEIKDGFVSSSSLNIRKNISTLSHSDIPIIVDRGASTISGIIKTFDGEPISGASISADCINCSESVETISTANGTYALYVSPGSWTVNAHVADHGQLSSRTVRVSSLLVKDIDFTLPPSDELFSVSGKVSVGVLPISGTSVSAVAYIDHAYRTFHAKTNSSGEYTLNLPAGSGYKIYAYHPDYGDFQPITGLHVSRDLSGKDFSMPMTHEVEVAFYEDSQRKIIPKAFISFENKDGGSYSFIVKDADEKEFVLPEGNYYVSVNIPGVDSNTLTTRTGTKIDSLNVSGRTFYRVYIPTRVSFGGIIEEKSGPISNAWVEIVSSDGKTKASKNTDENGEFEFSLPTGEYSFNISKKGFNPIKESINLNSDLEKSFNLEESAYTVSGKVSAGGSSARGAFVSAKEQNTGSRINAKTNSGGEYILNLPQGNWTLSAVADGYSSKTYKDPINISAQSISDIDFNLSERANLSDTSSQSIKFSEANSIIDSNTGVRLSLAPNSLSTSSESGSVQIKETTNVSDTTTTRPFGNVGKEIKVISESGMELKNLNREIELEFNYSKEKLDLAFAILGENNPTLEQVKELKLSYWDDAVQSWVELPSVINFYPKNASSYADLKDNDSGIAVSVKGMTDHLSLFSVVVSNVVVSSETPEGISLTTGFLKAAEQFASAIGNSAQSVRVATNLNLDDVLAVNRQGQPVSLDAVLSSSAKNSIKNSSALFAFAVGDTLYTSSSGIADIDLGGFTRIIMAENAALKITEASEDKISYNQTEGKVGYEFDRQGTDMTWEVDTVTVNATVRGTSLLVDLQLKQDIYEVYEGVVDFADKNTGEIYTLTKGEKLVVKSDNTLSIEPMDLSSFDEAEAAKIESQRSNLDDTGFRDISGDDWFAPHVDALSSRDIVSGYTGDYFKPANQINRAEAAKIVMLAKEGEVNTYNPNNVFNDVPLSAWYIKYVSKAKEQGVISGYDDGSFRGANFITRAEALKMILTSADTKVTERFALSSLFDDVSPESWYAPYVAHAKRNNIISGYEDNTFRPNDPITRAEFAKMVSIIYGFSTQ